MLLVYQVHIICISNAYHYQLNSFTQKYLTKVENLELRLVCISFKGAMTLAYSLVSGMVKRMQTNLQSLMHLLCLDETHPSFKRTELLVKCTNIVFLGRHQIVFHRPVGLDLADNSALDHPH